jgi:predicted GNAT superfamily acetyltransferase
MDLDKCRNCYHCKMCGTPKTHRCLINERKVIKTKKSIDARSMGVTSIDWAFVPCRAVKAVDCKPEPWVRP